MSDLLYPLPLVEALRVTPVSRSVQDEFESGAVQSRLMWGDRQFKRRFDLKHAPLTREEFEVLRGFYTRRNGQHDTFWFRDNVNRAGNAKVRFASPLQALREKLQTTVGVQLEESAPLQQSPDVEDVILATGARPLVWWDASRVVYFEYPIPGGTGTYLEATLYDASGNGRHGTWQTAAPNPGGILAQWQYHSIQAQDWVQTSGSVGLAASRPAVTLFCFARAPNVSHADQWFLSVGSGSNYHALGLISDATDYFTSIPHVTAGNQNNSPVNTWRSIAATHPDGADTGIFYANGAVVASSAVSARTYGDGKFTLGALGDGSSRVQTGIDARFAHAMVFDVELSGAQVLALHNLLAYQVGL